MKRIWKITAVILLILYVAACVFTVTELGTFNALRAAVGLLRITIGQAELVQIGSVPYDVYLADPETGYRAFQLQVEARGYALVDQMGAVYIAQRDGEYARITYWVNRYYAAWRWQ